MQELSARRRIKLRKIGVCVNVTTKRNSVTILKLKLLVIRIVKVHPSPPTRHPVMVVGRQVK